MTGAPDRRWQKSQWHAYTCPGSPSTVTSTRPHAQRAVRVVIPRLPDAGTHDACSGAAGRGTDAPFLPLLDAAVGVAGEAGGRGVAVDRALGRPGPAAEAGALVVGGRLRDALAVVHDERPVLLDRLADRAALEHEDLDAAVAGDELDRDVAVHDGASVLPDLVSTDRDPGAVVRVQRADGGGACSRGQRPRRARVHADHPDRDVGLGARGPGARRRGRGHVPLELTGDERDLDHATVVVDVADARDV